MVENHLAEIARRAEDIYATRLKADLESSHWGEFLAIEPESGDYFLGTSISDAADRANTAHPGKRPYVLRIGHEGAVHLGASGV